MKVCIMSCLNLGSVLNISKICYSTFCTLLKILNEIFKITQKRMGQYEKQCVILVRTSFIIILRRRCIWKWYVKTAHVFDFDHCNPGTDHCNPGTDHCLLPLIQAQGRGIVLTLLSSLSLSALGRYLHLISQRKQPEEPDSVKMIQVSIWQYNRWKSPYSSTILNAACMIIVHIRVLICIFTFKCWKPAIKVL